MKTTTVTEEERPTRLQTPWVSTRCRTTPPSLSSLVLQDYESALPCRRNPHQERPPKDTYHLSSFGFVTFSRISARDKVCGHTKKGLKYCDPGPLYCLLKGCIGGLDDFPPVDRKPLPMPTSETDSLATQRPPPTSVACIIENRDLAHFTSRRPPFPPRWCRCQQHTHTHTNTTHLLDDGEGRCSRQGAVERVVEEVGDRPVKEETERGHARQSLVREPVLRGTLLSKEVTDGEAHQGRASLKLTRAG